MDVNVETHIKGPPHIGVEIHKSDTLRWTGSIHSVNLGHQNREAVEHNIPSWQQIIINVMGKKSLINYLRQKNIAMQYPTATAVHISRDSMLSA